MSAHPSTTDIHQRGGYVSFVPGAEVIRLHSMTLSTRAKTLSGKVSACCRIPSHQHQEHVVAALAGLAQAREPLSGPGEQFRKIRARDEPRHQKEGRRVVRPE